jgi:hypothetical protein
MMNTPPDVRGTVNIGNPGEFTIWELAGITMTRYDGDARLRRPRHCPWACVPACGGVTARLRRRLIAWRNASSPSGRPIDLLRRSAAKAGSSASEPRRARRNLLAGKDRNPPDFVL